MRFFDSIMAQAFGGLAGMFAWLSVQSSQEWGWLYAIAAGAIFGGIIWKANVHREKPAG